MNLVLLYFALKYHGKWDEIYKALVNKEQINPHELYEIENKIVCKYTTIISADYPQFLKNVEKPPFVLFYYGNLSLSNSKNKRIIMLKNEPDLQIQNNALDKLWKKIEENKYIGVISDRCALNLKEYFKDCIVVTSKSVLEYANYDLAQHSLFISEYYSREGDLNYTARIMSAFAGLALLLPFNNTPKLQQFIANLVNADVELYAVPDNINASNSGTNFWIKRGAKLIDCFDEILN